MTKYLKRSLMAGIFAGGAALAFFGCNHLSNKTLQERARTTAPKRGSALDLHEEIKDVHSQNYEIRRQQLPSN